MSLLSPGQCPDCFVSGDAPHRVPCRALILGLVVQYGADPSADRFAAVEAALHEAWTLLNSDAPDDDPDDFYGED